MLIQTPKSKYDVIVIGGGHAGIEAALASARLGCSTLFVTMTSNALGRLSCNPAIGGTAKGHLVREIDALGGEMGLIADTTGIHFKMLNRSKGPAVWSLRCQSDRDWYSREATRRVLDEPGIDIFEDSITGIVAEGGVVSAVRPSNNFLVESKAVIVTTGTFLNGLMHTGERNRKGGRFGEPPANGLTGSLISLGFTAGRLKTGTPPRIDLDSVDLSAVTIQASDDPPLPFSYRTEKITNRMVPMYLTYTNIETHKQLALGFERSPLFSGKIKGKGPRYCPSIEDKIYRFAERERHHIFLEPEGYDTNVVYVNGFSTSMPEEIQYFALKTIRGLENVKLLRPGYAVEYDYFPPNQLLHSLETKLINGLYFAGQINGTSGYEEAASQGLIAGINAALKIQGKMQYSPSRSDAYIGVMIDDLINKSTDEPYRMFTSRAEHRLLLRQDNADRRLLRKGFEIGLITKEQIQLLDEKEKLITRGMTYVSTAFISPAKINSLLIEKKETPITESSSFLQILKRSNICLSDIVPHIAENSVQDIFKYRSVVEQIEIDAKYAGYISRELEIIARSIKFEELEIPEYFDYRSIKSLSHEGRERLMKILPRSIGQASRISGVTSADVSILTIHLRKQ